MTVLLQPFFPLTKKPDSIRLQSKAQSACLPCSQPHLNEHLSACQVDVAAVREVASQPGQHALRSTTNHAHSSAHGTGVSSPLSTCCKQGSHCAPAHPSISSGCTGNLQLPTLYTRIISSMAPSRMSRVGMWGKKSLPGERHIAGGEWVRRGASASIKAETSLPSL